MVLVYFTKLLAKVSTNQRKKLLAMNPGQDLNYHSETGLSIIWVIKVPTENDISYV